jgi:putative acetyltransferase
VRTADLHIRDEDAGDRDAIFDVVSRAFPTPAEAQLVDRLRAAGAATISLVALHGERLVGHVLFSPVRVDAEGSAASFDAIGLAPLAVAPDVQNAGIGAALTRAGLAACRGRRHPIVFVLGHPGYYLRFGFEPAAPRGLHYAAGFERAFFVAELVPGALAGRRGVVRYRPEFDGL